MQRVLKALLSLKPATLLFFCTIILLATTSRLAALRSVPSSISHDELIYAIETQSVALTGKGSHGSWNPWTLAPVHPDFAELTTVMMVPFQWLPLPIDITTKLPFIFMSLVLPFIMGFVAFYITQKRSVGVVTSCIALFNPWIWQFSRMSFDSYFSMFFLWLGVLPLLFCTGWEKLYAFPIFFLAFYQYQGHKLVFLPWVLLWCFYVVIKQLKGSNNVFSVAFWQKNFVKVLRQNIPTIIVAVASTLLFAFYVLVQLPTHSSQQRIGSILTPNHPHIMESVNKKRRLSLATPINTLLVNSYTVLAEEVIERYGLVFSPVTLFLESDAGSASFAVWFHGNLYLVEAAFVGIGLIALVKQKKYSTLLIIFAAVIVAPLPAVLSEDISLTFRSAMVIPVLLLLVGIGVSYCIEQNSKLLTGAVLLAYTTSIGFFAFLYFVRYPVVAAERIFFTDKIVSSYVNRVPREQIVVVYTKEPEFTFKTHVYYSNLFTKETAPDIQAAFANQEYSINNLTVTDDCFDMNTLQEKNTVSILDSDAYICVDGESKSKDALASTQSAVLKDSITFAAVKDSGEVYEVFNDRVCSDYNLNTYIHITKLEQFNPAIMNDKAFCETWLTDLSQFDAE